MTQGPAHHPLARRAEAMLRPGANRAAVEEFCAQASRIGLHGVLIPTSRVELVRGLLEGCDVQAIALIDLPWGAADSDVKRFETEVAVDLGAQEIQYMLHTPRLKDGERNPLLREMRDIVEAADERPVTIALESQLLTSEEVRTAFELALDAGVRAITVGSVEGPPPEADFIRGLRSLIGPKFMIKAASAFPQAELAQAMVDSGADRVQGGEQLLSLFR